MRGPCASAEPGTRHAVHLRGRLRRASPRRLAAAFRLPAPAEPGRRRPVSPRRPSAASRILARDPDGRPPAEGGGVSVAPPPRMDTGVCGPKPRGEAARACEPFGLLCVHGVHAGSAGAGATRDGLVRASRYCEGRCSRSARPPAPSRRPGLGAPRGPRRPPSRDRGRAGSRTRREAAQSPEASGPRPAAARDAAFQVQLSGAPLRAGHRGSRPGEDPAAGYARGRWSAGPGTPGAGAHGAALTSPARSPQPRRTGRASRRCIKWALFWAAAASARSTRAAASLTGSR